MKHLGDITKIDGAKIPAVDVVTGGSPCQDLSCAGKRSGMSKICPNCGWSAVGNTEESVCPECGTELEYTRSGLFMEQIRVMKEMREHDRRTGRSGIDVHCRYGIWENVPGALSSNKGADFQAVLTEFARVSVPNAPPVPMPDGGKWPKSGVFYDSMGRFSIAYRIHDAQYWGVPQRRRRLALVADFNGLSAAEILFDPQLRREAEDTEPDQAVADSGAQSRSEVQPECESVSGHSESGEAQGQGTAAATESGTGSSSISFQERAGKPGGGKGILIQEERTGALSTLNIQSVLSATAWTYRGRDGGCNVETQDELSYALRNPSGGGSQPNILQVGEPVPIEGNGQRESHRGNGYGNEGDPMFTLNSTEHHAVASSCLNPWDVQSKHIQTPDGVAESLYAGECRYGGGESYVMDGVEASGLVSKGNGEAFLTPEKHMSLGCGGGQAGQGYPAVVTTAMAQEAYGICSYDSNAMKSSNPHSGVYKTDTSRTLDLNGGSPACNQGGVAVVEVSEPTVYNGENITHPLNKTNPQPGDPCHTLGTDTRNYVVEEVAAAGFSFGQSAKARSIGYGEEVSPTLRGGEGGNQKPCVLDATAISGDISGTLDASYYKGCGERQGVEREVVVTMNPRPQSMVCQHDMAATLGADDYKEPQMVFDARGNGDGKTVCTLTGDHQNRVTDYTALCVGNGQLNQMSMTEQCNTLDTMHDHQAVMVAAVDCRNGTENPATNGTLQSKETGQNLNSNSVVRTAVPVSVVRRLTPTECCALQGFYSDWVEIGEWTDSKGKVHKDADSPKYNALGNSIAVGAANNQSGFWIWLARRICAQYERQVTMASFFDGISGFPLSFIIAGAKPVLSSEIEDFPIAVAKKHFGDEDAGIEGDVWQYLANQ